MIITINKKTANVLANIIASWVKNFWVEVDEKGKIIKINREAMKRDKISISDLNMLVKFISDIEKKLNTKSKKTT